MPSVRTIDRIAKKLAKPERVASDYGTIYAIYNNVCDVRMGNSPTLLKNVAVQGNADTLYVGQKVHIEWTERDGTIGDVPFIAGGSSEFISGQGGVSTVTVDNLTIEQTYGGLSVKKQGIGTQHLNFKPAFDDHTHKTPLEKGGWKFTSDGIMFTDKMYIHPQGLMKIGGGYPNEDDVIILDSLDTTYRLWAGHQTAASAPFSVSKAGAIKSTSGEIAGWTIDATKIAGGGIEMYSAGYIQSNPFTSGLIGFRIDDDVAEFNNVRVRGELHSAVFVYDELHASGGTFGVFPGAGVLLNDVTISGSCNVDIKDPDTGHAQIFSSGDRLRIKDGSGNDTWLTISSVSDQTTFYRYVCAYASGTNSVTYRAGATVVGYGASGDGYVTMSADGGIGSSPNMSLAIHNGSPWSSTTVLGRIGNLNGSYGQASDVYGFAFGDYDNERYIRWENNTSTLQIAGTIRIGQGSGFTTYALLHLPFDGPAPIKSNFDLNVHGHLGQSPSVYNSVSSWFGKWHKAGRFSTGGYNYINNPRAEVDTSSWTLYQSGTGATLTRSTAKSFIGAASLKILAGTGSAYIYSNTISSDASTYVSASVWIYVDGDTASEGILTIYDNTASVTRASTTATLTQGWQRLTAQWYNSLGTRNMTIRLRNTAADSTTNIYFDAVMASVEYDAVIRPYHDGDFPGSSWSSTAHNSSSTSASTELYYEGFDFPYEEGTISMWVQPQFYIDSIGSVPMWFSAYGATNGLQFGINSSHYLQAYIGGNNIAPLALTNSNFGPTGWYHVALTWNKTQDRFRLYFNGEQQGSDGNYGTWNPSETKMRVGHNALSTNFCGYIDDFVLVDREFTTPEVQQIYYSNEPLNVSGRNFSLYLAEAGVGKIVGDAGGIKAYDADEEQIWGLTQDGLSLQTGTIGGKYPAVLRWYDDFDTETIRAYISVNATYNMFIDAEGDITIGDTSDVVPVIELKETNNYVSIYGGQSSIADLRVNGGLVVGDVSQNPAQGQIWAYGNGSSYGFYAGTGADVQLFRGGADLWETPDSLKISGDIYTIDWTDYLSSSTITGWSSPTGAIYYKRVGDIVYVLFYIDGTSNSTLVNFTVPYNIANIGPVVAIDYQDNSTLSTTPGQAFGGIAAKVIYCYTNWQSGTWTASNNKTVWGQFWYWTTDAP